MVGFIFGLEYTCTIFALYIATGVAINDDNMRFKKIDTVNPEDIVDFRIGTYDVFSALMCALKCASDVPCQSYMHNRNTLSCNTYSVIHVDNLGGTTTPPWTFYTNIATPGGDCGESWLIDRTTDLCYIVVNSSVDFSTAKSQCHSMDAELASIHTQHEQMFIQDLTPLSDTMWIGLYEYETDTGRDFGWVDGTELGMSNWESGEPNGATEICVEMKMYGPEIGKWNNVLCSHKNSHICKKRVPTGP